MASLSESLESSPKRPRQAKRGLGSFVASWYQGTLDAVTRITASGKSTTRKYNFLWNIINVDYFFFETSPDFFFETSPDIGYTVVKCKLRTIPR